MTSNRSFHIILFLLFFFDTCSVGLLAYGETAEYYSYYDYYKVKSHDSWESLASRIGVHPLSLKKMNLGVQQLTLGTVIRIPSKKAVLREQNARSAKKDKSRETQDSALNQDKTVVLRAKAISEEERASAWSESSLTGFSQAEEQYLIDKYLPKNRPVANAHVNKVRAPNGAIIVVPKAKSRAQESFSEPGSMSQTGRHIDRILQECKGFLGVPYVWGGEQVDGVDCSGLIQYVYQKHGIRMPRTADIQYLEGVRVFSGKERPGDLVFFETYAPGASHVGVYVGKRVFIHASSSQAKVTYGTLSDPYFRARYLGAKRVIP